MSPRLRDELVRSRLQEDRASEYHRATTRAVAALALALGGILASTFAGADAKTICCNNVDEYWRALERHLGNRKCEPPIVKKARDAYYDRVKAFGDVAGAACGQGTCKPIADLAGAVTDIAHASKCVGEAPLVLPTPITVNVVGSLSSQPSGSASSHVAPASTDLGQGGTVTIFVSPIVGASVAPPASSAPPSPPVTASSCCCGNEQNKKPSEAAPPAPVAVPAVQAIEGSALTVPRAGESRALVIDAPVGFNDGTSSLATGVNISPAGLWYAEDDAAKLDPRWSALHVSVAGAAVPRRGLPGATPPPTGADGGRTTIWAAALTYDVVPFIVSHVSSLLKDHDLATCIADAATGVADDAGRDGKNKDDTSKNDKGKDSDEDLYDKKPTYGHLLRRATIKAIRDCVVDKLPLSVDLAIAARRLESTMPRTWLAARYAWTYTALEAYGGVDIARAGRWDAGARLSATPAIFTVAAEAGIGGPVRTRDVGAWLAATAAFHLFDGIMLSIGPRVEWRDGTRDDRLFVSVGWAGWDWRAELFRRKYDIARSAPEKNDATSPPATPPAAPSIVAP